MGEVKTLDARGLKCPQPIMKVAGLAKTLAGGDTIVVLADCPSFPGDMEAWCEKTGRMLIDLREQDDGSFRAEIEL